MWTPAVVCIAKRVLLVPGTAAVRNIERQAEAKRASSVEAGLAIELGRGRSGRGVALLLT